MSCVGTRGVGTASITTAMTGIADAGDSMADGTWDADDLRFDDLSWDAGRLCHHLGLADLAAGGIRNLAGAGFLNHGAGGVRDFLRDGFAGPAAGCVRNLFRNRFAGPRTRRVRNSLGDRFAGP